MRIKKILIIFLLIIVSTLTVYADNCYDIFGSGLMEIIKDDVLVPLKIIAPILLLVFTSIDFAKNVFSSNKEGMQKALQNFLKRAVATLLVFFAPDIIDFLLGLVDKALCKM